MESHDTYKSIFRSLELTVDLEVIAKIQKFVLLLRKWNSRINLISTNEWSLIKILLQEGLWASKFYPGSSNTHLDIGSGAGFPVIPIKILNPNVKMDLVDSRLKRISFLETIARELNISHIQAHHNRIGQFLESKKLVWDCISWKALKVKNKDLFALVEHSHSKTQFWIFHGKELAVESPQEMQKILQLIRKEQFPYKSEWMLSIYLPK